MKSAPKSNSDFDSYVVRFALAVYAAVLVAGLACLGIWAGPIGLLFAFSVWSILFIPFGMFLVSRERVRRSKLHLDHVLTEPGLGLEKFSMFRPRESFVMGPGGTLIVGFKPRVREKIDGVAIALLECELSVFNGRGRPRLSMIRTVAVLQRRGTQLPDFLIHLRGRGLNMDLGGLIFGRSDITFSDHPDFSRIYSLHGMDNARIRESFNSRVLDFFEQHCDLAVEMKNQRMVYVRGVVVEEHEVSEFMQDAIQLLNLLRL